MLAKMQIILKIKGPALLHSPTNLAFTPPTLVEEPPDVCKVTARLVSEDSRINSTQKLQLLMRLYHQMFCSCSELFYCEINDCIELSCIGKRLMEKMIIEEGKVTVPLNCVGLETENKCDCTTSLFVAVKVTQVEKVRLFVSEKKSSQFAFQMEGLKITCHWYETHEDCNPHYVYYCFSYPHEKGKVKRRTIVEAVASDVTIFSFPSFKRNRTLLPAGHKELKSEVVGQLFKNRK